MIELGEPYAQSWRGRPPGMPDPDVPVWYRFLEADGVSFDRLYYNVRITTEDPSAATGDPLGQSVARALLPKRIDALGERRDELHIIEVAERPGLRSIGQLVTYRALWRALRPEDRRVIILTLVCSRCGADEALAAAEQGIRVAHA